MAPSCDQPELCAMHSKGCVPVLSGVGDGPICRHCLNFELLSKYPPVCTT
jgi:hypothetical protein